MTIQEKQYLKKQEQMLQVFYKEFFSWKCENTGLWIAAGLMEFFQCIFMWIPYQEMRDDNIMIWMYFGILGTMLYVMPYVQFQENGKRSSIYAKMKYLPVTLQGIRIFRFKKLTRFCLKMLVVFLAGQLFFSLVVYHEITWGNIWYPVILGFLVPYGVSGIGYCFCK